MRTSDGTAKIAKALAQAQGEFRRVARSGVNNHGRYKFSDLADYFDVVRPVLAKHELSLASTAGELQVLDKRQTKSGGVQYGYMVTVATRLLHSSGEWLEATAYGEGYDSGDKAVYKAVTGGRKYALASLLGLATSDDPERDDPPPKTREEPATKPDKPDKPDKVPDLEEQRLRAVRAFGAVGLVPDDLGRFLAGTDEPPLPMSSWTTADLGRLRGAMLAIKAAPDDRRQEAIAKMFALPSSALEG